VTGCPGRWRKILSNLALALNRTIQQSPLRQFSGGLADLLLVASSVAILLAFAGDADGRPSLESTRDLVILAALRDIFARCS
jgi:hypothetical protein